MTDTHLPPPAPTGDDDSDHPGPAPQITDPRLREALEPYLERHRGHTLKAVTELLADLRFAVGDETEFDTALEAAADRPPAMKGADHG